MIAFDDIESKLLTSDFKAKLFVVTDDMRNEKEYQGAENKFGITVNDVDYLVKLRKNNWLNCYSEHIGSRFIRACGGFAQKTILSLYKDKVVVICEDFTNIYGNLKTFSNLSSSSFDTDPRRYDYYFEDIIHELKKLYRLDMDSELINFWMMYLFDIILGNPDRHGGNWGVYLKNDKYKFSPIFDNGATLFPRITKFTVDSDWMRERIYTFPNPKIMFKELSRSGYYEVIKNGICPKCVIDTFKSFDVILSIDKATNGFTEEARKFYRTVVFYRYSCLIKGEDFVWKGMI